MEPDKRRTASRNVDDAIYRLRVVERCSWRAIGGELDLAHETVRERFYRLIDRVTVEDIELLRMEENMKLDDLESRYMSVYRRTMEHGDEAAALKALGGLLAVHGKRARINGLLAHVREPETISIESLKAKMGAYVERMQDPELT